jgi:hypothetical protein
MAALLKFGAPVGSIFQVAYTVPDLQQGMKDFAAGMGVGPWYVLNYEATPNARYRGQPTPLRITIAVGWAGNVNVELFEIIDDTPSVYRDRVEAQGHGFHHWAIGSRSFEADVARYEAMGYELAFYDHHVRGRVAYMDTTRDMPGYMEICEMTEIQENRMFRMWEAAQGFDGTDPVRTAPLT